VLRSDSARDRVATSSPASHSSQVGHAKSDTAHILPDRQHPLALGPRVAHDLLRTTIVAVGDISLTHPRRSGATSRPAVEGTADLIRW
jgi:hypothetical protein